MFFTNLKPFSNQNQGVLLGHFLQASNSIATPRNKMIFRFRAITRCFLLIFAF
jgi:hypothetical protein